MKTVSFLFILLHVWYFIVVSSGLTTAQGEFVAGGERETLIMMGLIMTAIYLPLCHLAKSFFSFPSSSQYYRHYEKLVILMFYIFIVVSSIPILNEKRALPLKAKESEAKQYVGSMNRTQQSKYAENGSFVNSIDALGLGIKTETTNYRYSIEMTKNTAFNYGGAKNQKLKSFVGGVFLVNFDKVTQKITTVSILCKEKKAGTSKPNPPLLKNDQAVCGEGTEEVKK
ncbi:MAG: type IV pilin-like G/H family protein [Microcoleaceae cyanobacterium]